MEKIKILTESPDPNDETAHLRPIIEFLKEQGNEPLNRSGFIFDKGGFGEMRWKKPFNVQKIQDHFILPESIQIDSSGEIHDQRNALYLIPAAKE